VTDGEQLLGWSETKVWSLCSVGVTCRAGGARQRGDDVFKPIVRG
jgi:hypothetical protein